MIIKKVRITDEFSFDWSLISTKDSHGKFADKSGEIDQIINAGLDGLKIKLKQYLNTIPNKVG